MSVRGPRGGGSSLRVAPVGAQPAIEIGLQHAQRIGIAPALFVQIQQLAVGQAIERAPGEAAGEHGAADVTRAVVDPGLQEGRAHLGAPSGAGRAEAAGRPVAHARGRSAPVITRPARPNSSGSRLGRKRRPKISMPPTPMAPSTNSTMRIAARQARTGWRAGTRRCRGRRRRGRPSARTMAGMAHGLGAGRCWPGGAGARRAGRARRRLRLLLLLGALALDLPPALDVAIVLGAASRRRHARPARRPRNRARGRAPDWSRPGSPRGPDCRSGRAAGR